MKKKGGPLEKFNDRAKEVYLETIAARGTITAACDAACVSRQCVWEHREKYPEFAEAEELARQRYRDEVVEREIQRRAIEGIDKPVYYKGQRIDTIKEYSDTLLIFHAKRHIPEYRDAPIQITQTTTVLQVPERLAQHIEARRAMLKEIAVVDHVPGTGKTNGNGDGNSNGHSD